MRSSVLIRDVAQLVGIGIGRKGVVRFARQRPLGAAGGLVFVFAVVLALFPGMMAQYDPTAISREAIFSPSSAKFLFGTDDLGRDLFSRLIWGARFSMYVAAVATLVAMLMGTFFGLVSGWMGGAVDSIVQRTMDALLAIPLLLIALVIVFALGPSLNNVTASIAVAMTPMVNRIVRAVVLSIKGELYVGAAQAIGCSNTRILAYHILPQCFGSMLAVASIYFPWAIIAEASISFVGLGATEPTPTWGGILASGIKLYIHRAPWIALFAGLCLAVVILGVSYLGDALRDELDPRMRRL